MCRLFGFRSDNPARVHRSLISEKNSLRTQSVEHRDGWGIAYYDRGAIPEVAHGLGPAHSDPEFERVSGLLSSHAVLAHVRLASVGAVHLRNAHPFLYGSWAFAHNGTITAFQRHQAELEREIDGSFLKLIRGETDSERCFYLFMTRLQALTRLPDEVDAKAVAKALAQTLAAVSRITDGPEGKPSSMNFMVTNGKLIVATRRHRSLFLSEQNRAQGRHGPPPDAAQLDQLVIASEELSGEDHWHEIPEESIVAVDGGMTFRRWPVSALERD
jgi:glutamine amidotransferase